MFAKLFDTTEGQILIKRGTNESYQPEIRMYFETEDTYCDIALAFGDDEKADKAFAEMGEEKAVDLIRKLKGNIEAEKGASK